MNHPCRVTTLSIDSRFADQYYSGTADFLIRLPSIMRNVSRIALTSVEVPQVAYVFSAAAGNTSFFMDISGVRKVAGIADASYTPAGLAVALNATLTQPVTDVSGLAFSYNSVTNRFSITNGVGASVAITLSASFTTTARYWGLGYWLGFRTQTFVIPAGSIVTATAAPITTPPAYALVQVQCPDMIESTLHRTAAGSYVPALAKIVLRGGSYVTQYDDAANLVIKENIYPSQTAITQLRITLVDATGALVQMGDTDWSLTLEVTEVVSSLARC
jgi:hypothetical protein